MDADGDFVTVRGGDGVFVQRYSSQGTAQGPEILVSTTPITYLDATEVRTDDEGNFVVMWSARGASDTNPLGYSRRTGRRAVPSSGPAGPFLAHSTA